MQAQGHLQMMLRIFAAGQGMQAAVEAPRWQVVQGHEVSHEAEFDPAIIDDLKRRGHLMERSGFIGFGGCQMIRRLDNDIFEGASDNRKDGHAGAF
jgi:gamma-glutamyltranspeptidase/glutathione hydrolase